MTESSLDTTLGAYAIGLVLGLAVGVIVTELLLAYIRS